MRRVAARSGLVIAFAIATAATITFAKVPHHAPAPTSPSPPQATAAPRVNPPSLPGWELYVRHCLACHGARGDGRGPAAAWSWMRPRDFTHGEYAWRTSAVGQPPSDDDVRATIRWGAPGTSMPAFGDVLSADDIERVRVVIAAFAPPTGAPHAPLATSATPPPPAPVRGAILWKSLGCVGCHGASGEGDGPSAATLAIAPYDLTRELLHRPRAPSRPGDDTALRTAAMISIATGMTGTPMPGYDGAAPPADLWAVADYVVELGRTARARDGSTLDADSIDRDRRDKLPAATWPGAADDPEAIVFGGPIQPQGAPPPSLAPAQASLHARQCGRCHAKQAREWQDSIHAQAMSPGVTAQIDHGFAPAEVTSCQRCHAPLAEQLMPAARDPNTPAAPFDADLRAEGVTCAGCHLRAWVRHGPARLAASLLPAPAYPLVTLAIYERADMCLACHQLPPRFAVAGRPLLNTYKEWLESPYMARGIECQHCHMPNREHTFLGVHDPDTVRQSFTVAARAHRADHGVTVVATMTNIGAGHFLPTTSTPSLWLIAELVDNAGTAIAGARSEQRIGRDVYYDTAWHERSDTRIAPGGTITMARAWRDGRTADAAWVRVTVEVHPDEYYEHFYAAQLAGKLDLGQRALYEQALERAKGSHYTAEYQVVPIAP